MRSVQRAMCSGMLGLQAVVLLLVGVTLPVVADVSPGAGVGIGVGLAVLCVLAAGMMRRPFGLGLGWAIQVLSIGLGFVVTAMFALGIVFLALYGGSAYLGAKIDRERAERAALEEPGAAAS